MNRIALIILIFLLAGTGCQTLPGSAQDRSPSPMPTDFTGTITRLVDEVERNDNPISGTVQLFIGDKVGVFKGGEGLLDFGNDLRMRLFNDTRTGWVDVKAASGTPLDVRLYLEMGGFTGHKTKTGFQVTYETPGGAKIIVLGTLFFIVYDPAIGMTWVGNFDGILGVAASGKSTTIAPGYYVAIPSGQPPGLANPIPFTIGDFEGRSRQLRSPILALKELIQVETTATSTPMPASVITNTPTPTPTEALTQEAKRDRRKASEEKGIPTTPADRNPPSITVIEASPLAIGVGLACPRTPSSTRVKASVSDESGVSSVMASWSQGGKSGVVPMSSNAKGYYIADINLAGSTGKLDITITAQDTYGNTAMANPIRVKVLECTDREAPVIGSTKASPQQLEVGPTCVYSRRVSTVTANVSDNVGLKDVTATWRLGGQQATLTMDANPAGIYQATIGPFDTPGDVIIEITAEDTSGNMAQLELPAPITVIQCDTTPPAIENLAASPDAIAVGPVCLSAPVTTLVTAVVKDDFGVSRVTASWKLGGNGDSVTMMSSDQVNYQVSLGPFYSTGELSIRISAKDTSGLEATSTPIIVIVQDCAPIKQKVP